MSMQDNQSNAALAAALIGLQYKNYTDQFAADMVAPPACRPSKPAADWEARMPAAYWQARLKIREDVLAYELNKMSASVSEVANHQAMINDYHGRMVAAYREGGNVHRD